jgi:muconate cycloisomerase
MYTDDVLATGMGYRDGALVVPDGPGWGIDVDPDKLRRFSVEKLEVQA